MSPPRPGRLAPTIVSLALAWTLAGCAHSTRVASDRMLRVALTEYRLNPQNVHARAGSLTLIVRNYGRLTHNLVISRDGQPEGSTRPLGPGQSAIITLTLGPGSYRMASTILSDQDLGEYGTLSVSS